MIRRASRHDAQSVAVLLHEFASEFGDPSPGVVALAANVDAALAARELDALLAAEPPAGVALLTYRPSVWHGAAVATLDDLYVRPQERDRGLGRALLRAAVEAASRRGAAAIELYTGAGDVAARALYEAHGFANVEPGETDRLLFYSRRLGGTEPA
jgi:ribosomal protein S18 acetylase RimI-like enzyme